jgi:hypothetical protein
MIQVQLKDFDDVGVGWLFAPILGVWGLGQRGVGHYRKLFVQKAPLLCLLPAFVLIHISLGFTSWMVTV